MPSACALSLNALKSASWPYSGSIVLDTASCVVQGVIPYGAQILIAAGVAKAAQVPFGSLELVKSLYYPPLLALAVLLAMLVPRKRFN